MSEEEVKAPEAAPVEGGAANGEGKTNGKERKPRDETPIEELYDLSKPIPKVRDCLLVVNGNSEVTNGVDRHCIILPHLVGTMFGCFLCVEGRR